MDVAHGGQVANDWRAQDMSYSVWYSWYQRERRHGHLNVLARVGRERSMAPTNRKEHKLILYTVALTTLVGLVTDDSRYTG